MDELSEGFRIDDRLVAWGTRLGDVPSVPGLRMLGQPSEMSIGLACRSAYGFAAFGARLAGPAPDRPVLTVSYELAPPKDGAAALAGSLAQRFGPPTTTGKQPLPKHGYAWSVVVEWAQWSFGDVLAGVSIYGALRAVDGGEAAGLLWLRWADEAAAKPYLQEWLRQSAELERLASRLTAIEIFELGMAQLPPLAEAVDVNRLKSSPLRLAGLCLYRPSLCITPPSVAQKLSKSAVAIWRTDDTWCLSTRWDSLLLGKDRPVAANHIELMPAKGSGMVYLEVGAWSARDGYPSPAMARIAEALAQVPGVAVKHTRDYDY